MPEDVTPGVQRVQSAVVDGDIDGLRKALATLGQADQDLLRLELGSEAFDRARQTATRGPRGAKRGKVLVLPGIMGSLLDVVDKQGDADRIWLNPINLIRGRLEELALTPGGEPATPGTHVQTAGLFREFYIPLLIELDTHWQVRPFAYDWRESIDRSAARLEAEVRAFGNGDPVHLVAHSMGGLVSRRFIQRYPDTWAAMNDTTGRGRGGRLVMLGTPNRGSFSIPPVLTGKEEAVEKLAFFDLKHSLREVLAIVSTFPGLYELLPSPFQDLGDDHVKLYKASNWGSFRVHQAHLDAARKLHEALRDVIDPGRLLYVAGFDRSTLSAVKITGTGAFSFQRTRDGDGKVTHALGLLPGVTTFFVDEDHGALAKNDRVLAAIHDLLARGTSTVLSTVKPASRAAAARAGDDARVERNAVEMARLEALRARAGRDPKRIGLTPAEQIEVQQLILSDYRGNVEAPPVGAPPPAPPRQAGPRRQIPIQVIWGDVTRIRADVHTVGHYQGVAPQQAELALDCAVSGVSMREVMDEATGDEARRRLVITQHTRRGQVRGAVGDIDFFPDHDMIVAVAGMGRPGTFDFEAMRRVIRGLVLGVGALPRVRSVCTVLIGSGEGTLTVSEAARALLLGIADALADASTGATRIAPVDRIVVGELYRGRATEIVSALREHARSREISERIDFKVTGPRRGPGGRVGTEDQLTLLLDAAVRASTKLPTSPEGMALASLLADIQAPEPVKQRVSEGLRALGEASQAPGLGYTVRRRGPRQSTGAYPVRISFWRDAGQVHAAAITETSTVAERIVKVDPTLVGALVQRMTNPPLEGVGKLSDMLARLLVPHEFAPMMQGPLVFEVDRAMAEVHWEMCAGGLGDDSDTTPLGVRYPLARQLRTTYSPAPTRDLSPDRPVRVLVVGDPGDPEQGYDLPGARREALRVLELFRAHAAAHGGIEVEGRIGAPNVARTGPLSDIPHADRLEVLYLLMQGRFDVIHYAGHGDFDPDQPDRVGWLFADGLITSGELQRLVEAPRLVVANACLSGRTSQVRENGKNVERAGTEAGLLPSLADEFFKLGARNYIGTAWEVNDLGAELFATTLYRALLDGKRMGEAVLAARQAIWNERSLYGALWGAYQHYGDPLASSPLVHVETSGGRR